MKKTLIIVLFMITILFAETLNNENSKTINHKIGKNILNKKIYKQKLNKEFKIEFMASFDNQLIFDYIIKNKSEWKKLKDKEKDIFIENNINENIRFFCGETNQKESIEIRNMIKEGYDFIVRFKDLNDKEINVLLINEEFCQNKNKENIE